jgi:hypothetical protein
MREVRLEHAQVRVVADRRSAEGDATLAEQRSLARRGHRARVPDAVAQVRAQVDA